MEDSPCPKCGYRRERYLMASNPDAPGLFGLLRGEGEDRLMRWVAWLGVMVFAVVVVGAFFAVAGIHP